MDNKISFILQEAILEIDDRFIEEADLEGEVVKGQVAIRRKNRLLKMIIAILSVLVMILIIIFVRKEKIFDKTPAYYFRDNNNYFSCYGINSGYEQDNYWYSLPLTEEGIIVKNDNIHITVGRMLNKYTEDIMYEKTTASGSSTVSKYNGTKIVTKGIEDSSKLLYFVNDDIIYIIFGNYMASFEDMVEEMNYFLENPIEDIQNYENPWDVFEEITYASSYLY